MNHSIQNHLADQTR
jgi:endo-1,4-beta-xylanase